MSPSPSFTSGMVSSVRASQASQLDTEYHIVIRQSVNEVVSISNRFQLFYVKCVFQQPTEAVLSLCHRCFFLSISMRQLFCEVGTYLFTANCFRSDRKAHR